MSSDFSNHWKVYLSGLLSEKVISYLGDYFRVHQIDNPTLDDIKAITLDEALNSRYPLSVASVKELIIFTQKLK